jgi:uncharacterized membrane protein
VYAVEQDATIQHKLVMKFTNSANLPYDQRHVHTLGPFEQRTYLPVKFKLYLMKTITPLSPLVYICWEVKLRSPSDLSRSVPTIRFLFLTFYIEITHTLRGTKASYAGNSNQGNIVTHYLRTITETFTIAITTFLIHTE